MGWRGISNGWHQRPSFLCESLDTSASSWRTPNVSCKVWKTSWFFAATTCPTTAANFEGPEKNRCRLVESGEKTYSFEREVPGVSLDFIGNPREFGRSVWTYSLPSSAARLSAILLNYHVTQAAIGLNRSRTSNEWSYWRSHSSRYVNNSP